MNMDERSSHCSTICIRRWDMNPTKTPRGRSRAATTQTWGELHKMTLVRLYVKDTTQAHQCEHPGVP